MGTEGAGRTLQEMISRRLERDPAGKAFLFYDGASNSPWLTFEACCREAAGYANALQEFGLGPGRVCVIVLPSGRLALMLTTATLMLGGVPLLIAPPSLQAEAAFSNLSAVIRRIIFKTKPAVVVIPQQMTLERYGLRHRGPRSTVVVGEGEVTGEPSQSIRIARTSEDAVAAMQPTSGTTGFPRVCVWKQKNVVAALEGMAAAMGLCGGEVCLNWTPLYHDMGLAANFFLCLMTGTPLVMMSPSEFVKQPALWLRGLSETGASLTWSPNFGFAITAQRVRDAEIRGVRLDGVRAFWNGSERVHYDTLLAFHKRFEPYGVRFEALKTAFGGAEIIAGATFSPPDGQFMVEQIDRRAFLDRGLATAIPAADSESVSVVGVGRPHPGLRVRILSPRGHGLEDGHVGEIALDTHARMSCYLGDARATRRSLHDGLVRTGDLGYLRSGELFWVGRVRERINVRGTKLDPSDLEPVMLQVPHLRHGSFVAFGVDDPVEGTQKLVIVAEVRDAAPTTPDEVSGDIRSRVFERLGVSVGDVVLVRTGTLTKTSSGKRRHRLFRRLYQERRLADYQWKPARSGD